jgi:hypothetical protein
MGLQILHIFQQESLGAFCLGDAGHIKKQCSLGLVQKSVSTTQGVLL